MNPEGDRATGRQLINNILMVKLGDEGEGGLRTEGLERIHRIFYERVRGREIDGQRPFQHIKAWYNMFGYWDGFYAATPEDATKRNRVILPANCEFIGPDVYQWWGHPWAPFDPYGPDASHERILEVVQHWHDTFTRYYPEGLNMRGHQPGDAGGPDQQNDTHAMLGAVELGNADRAMLFYIGLSSQLGGPPYSYTTPIETMDAYYDNLKAGPWVGLSWWYFDNTTTGAHGDGTVSIVDETLLHRTSDNPEGTPYPPEQMAEIQRRFLESRQRMFDDVVYGQFGHINGEKSKEPSAGD